MTLQLPLIIILNSCSLFYSYTKKNRTNPISASASVKAIPKNIVVLTIPAASGCLAIACTALPSINPIPIPGPIAASPYPINAYAASIFLLIT